MLSKDTKYIKLTVFIISLTILSYEIILTRIFSITQWHNLSSLIISMAMLGFGASGSLILMLKKKIDKNLNSVSLILLFVYPVSIIFCFIISSKIPFNPFEIAINNEQIFYFIAYFFLAGLPFLFGASIIGIMLLKFETSKIYFSNLIGAGTGAFLIIFGLHYFHPFDILIIIVLLSFSATVIFSANFNKIYSCSVILLSLFFTAFFYFSFDLFELKNISEYKSLSRTLTLPNSKIIEEKFSPLGLVQVVQADGLRSTPGLSLLSPYEVPVQKAIFFDGGSMSAITPYSGDDSQIKYLDYLPSSLAYHLLGSSKKNDVLIVGTGGGEGLLKAKLNKFKNITGVEIDKNVISLMKNQFAQFSGNIYNMPGIKIINEEARGYITKCDKKFDLIEISMIDAYNSAASGSYALNETYLYTRESIKEFLLHLKDDGILSISRWIITPPKDNLKILNICVDALKKTGVREAAEHIVFIRNIQAATLIISKSPLRTEEIAKAKEFCKTRLFDLIYYNKIKESEINKYVKLKYPVYYNFSKELLEKNNKKYIIDAYDFNIESASDNKPYFYNFFKLKTLNYIFKNGLKKVPVTEWGYLLLIIILIPVLIISFLFIILPLFFIGKLEKAKRNLNFNIISYFALIGLAYFFIEMPLIQKLILFLSHPAYSLSVIISGLLIFSGIGCYFSDKIFTPEKRILYSTILISFFTILNLIFSNYIFACFYTYSDPIRIMVTLVLLLPVGFFMGIPFPQGIKKVKLINKELVPWVWGINGFFSVISIITATIFAIIFGFQVVFITATGFYLLAGFISLKME
jgi:spermidine synthase